MNPDDVVSWESDPPQSVRLRIEEIDPFDARGMKRVYGRGDHFPGTPALNIDIWQSRSGRLFARFWSRGEDVDEYSYELHGIPPEAISNRDSDSAFSDAWLPKKFRKKYKDWVLSEICTPRDMIFPQSHPKVKGK